MQREFGGWGAWEQHLARLRDECTNSRGPGASCDHQQTSVATLSADNPAAEVQNRQLLKPHVRYTLYPATTHHWSRAAAPTRLRPTSPQRPAAARCPDQCRPSMLSPPPPCPPAAFKGIGEGSNDVLLSEAREASMAPGQHRRAGRWRRPGGSTAHKHTQLWRAQLRRL